MDDSQRQALPDKYDISVDELGEELIVTMLAVLIESEGKLKVSYLNIGRMRSVD